MNQELFDLAWAEAPLHLKRALKDFAKYPTERNSCFISGYLSAMDNSGVLSSETYLYLLALTGQIGESKELQTLVLTR